MIRMTLLRFDASRHAARDLASVRVSPADVTWIDPDTPHDLFGADAPPSPGRHAVTATQEFLQLARQVASRFDFELWSLIYVASGGPASGRPWRRYRRGDAPGVCRDPDRLRTG